MTCGVTMSMTPTMRLLGEGHLQHDWACKDIAAPPEQHAEHPHAKLAGRWLLELQGQPLHCACPVHSLLTPAASFLKPLTLSQSAADSVAVWTETSHKQRLWARMSSALVCQILALSDMLLQPEQKPCCTIQAAVPACS